MAVGVDSTKARILEAAGNVFAQKGYEAATVREICQAANANLAAVNYHFGDKQRLYIEAVKHAHRFRAESIPLPQWPPGTEPAVKLRELITVMLERMLGDDASPWHAQLMQREIASPTVACEELVRDYIRPQFATLSNIVRELLPANTPDEKVSLTAFSVVGQCLFYRLAQPVVRLLLGDRSYENLTRSDLAEHISGLMLAALGVDGAVAASARRKSAEAQSRVLR